MDAVKSRYGKIALKWPLSYVRTLIIGLAILCACTLHPPPEPGTCLKQTTHSYLDSFTTPPLSKSTLSARDWFAQLAVHVTISESWRKYICFTLGERVRVNACVCTVLFTLTAMCLCLVAPAAVYYFRLLLSGDVEENPGPELGLLNASSYNELQEENARLWEFVNNLQTQLDRLEGFSRRNNIRFFNVFEGEKEDVSVCARKVVQLLTRFFPWKEWSIRDIERAHRTGPRTTHSKWNRPRTLIE